MIEGKTIELIFSANSESHTLSLREAETGQKVTVLVDRGQLTTNDFYWDNLLIYFEAFEKAMNSCGTLSEMARYIRQTVRVEHMSGLVTSPELIDMVDEPAMATAKRTKYPDK